VTNSKFSQHVKRNVIFAGRLVHVQKQNQEIKQQLGMAK
jgi:hypothetical protein